MKKTIEILAKKWEPGSQAPQAQPPPSVSCSEWVEELTTALWKLEDLRDKAQKARGDLDEYRAFEEILDLIQNAMKLIRSSSTHRI